MAGDTTKKHMIQQFDLFMKELRSSTDWANKEAAIDLFEEHTERGDPNKLHLN